MREKSLKFIVRSLLLPMGTGLIGCTQIYRRPTSLVYPKSQNTNSNYSAYQSNYGYYPVQSNAQNQTFASNYENQGYQPTQRQNYTSQQPVMTQSYTPQQKIQTPALNSKPVVEQEYFEPKNITTQNISTNQKTENKITQTPTPKKENVILEEVIYIPSALQTTPVDEIEILSESKTPLPTTATTSTTTPAPAPVYTPAPANTVATVVTTPAEKTEIKNTENKQSSVKVIEPTKISEPAQNKEQITQTKTNNENKVVKIEPTTQKVQPITTQTVPTTKTTIRELPKQTAVNTAPVKNIPEQKAEPQKPKTVKVYKGDTLYSIAQRYNIKVYDLAEHNKLKAPFTLKPGQTIEIPGEKPTKPIKAPEIITNLNVAKTFIEEPKKDFVTVKKGDTIYSIAKQNNVPLKDIILRNNLIAPYTLSIGEKIYIPNTAFHIVKAQDTAYSISRKYNVNLNSLVKLNKLTEPYTLTIGQKILLPATNVDIVQKQIKYVVKDKETTKTVQPSVHEEVKEVAKVRVAEKQKVEEKPKPVQTKTEIAKQEIIKSIIVKPEPLTSKRFLWPLNGKVISSYGVKNNGKRNDGVNISAKLGSPVVASENGIVAYAGNELKGLGNLIIIKHDKDYMTIYAHNETILVRKGDMVKRGDNIATVGKTGRVTTPQLHFEIREKTKSIDPSDVLEKK